MLEGCRGSGGKLVDPLLSGKGDIKPMDSKLGQLSINLSTIESQVG